MRPIKFRGFTADGKWVYGYYWSNSGNDAVINYVVVLPESVGQFTGLKDKKGVEIYEGDVVEQTHQISDGRTGVVKWDNYGLCAFVLEAEGQRYDLAIYMTEGSKQAGQTLEVIGNIHQNPELLK